MSTVQNEGGDLHGGSTGVLEGERKTERADKPSLWQSF